VADALQLLDQQVDRLGGPVGHAAGVELGEELGFAYSGHHEGAFPVRCSMDSTTSIFLAGKALSPSPTPITRDLLADPGQYPSIRYRRTFFAYRRSIVSGDTPHDRPVFASGIRLAIWNSKAS